MTRQLQLIQIIPQLKTTKKIAYDKLFGKIGSVGSSSISSVSSTDFGGFDFDVSIDYDTSSDVSFDFGGD